jgi:fatty acid synthase, animal type
VSVEVLFSFSWLNVLLNHRLFQNGVDINIAKLYPAVSFPVSRNTPMVSPLIKWNHDIDFAVPYMSSYLTFERRNLIINLNDKAYEYVQGHVIDGELPSFFLALISN